MRLSNRRFLIANDDVFYRISNVKFERMMRDPGSERLPLFSSQRIRMADLVIELLDREPQAVCREAFSIIQFDDEGQCDVLRYDSQQIALVNAMLAPFLPSDRTGRDVVEAADRFVAQGGSWTPTDSLRNQIEKAALGLLKCPIL
ncbi:MAG: hypothetical protein ACOYNZ_13975 [Rhodoferax sp.]